MLAAVGAIVGKTTQTPLAASGPSRASLLGADAFILGVGTAVIATGVRIAGPIGGIVGAVAAIPAVMFVDSTVSPVLNM